MDQQEFTEFLRKSREYLLEQQEVIKKKYSIDDYERMDYEQETNEMIFTHHGKRNARNINLKFFANLF